MTFFKKIILLLACFTSLLCAENMNMPSSFELINLYREGGVKALDKELDRLLTLKSYWSEVLKDKDTRFGYYEDLKFLFVAQKDPSILYLYTLENNQLKERIKVNSIVGSKGGEKLTEGDLATPIGVYNLTARLSNLPQYYGPLAFNTSYPNLYDKLNDRTGYGIWIHGLPLNGDRERNTKGCIAINNQTLTEIDQLIAPKDSLLITYEKDIYQAKKDDLATLLANLYIWRDAWIKNDTQTYLSFYSKEDFKRFDKSTYESFALTKERIFNKGEKKQILFSKINIAPYPNDLNEPLFRISFYEEYKAPSYSFNGEKELYVLLKNDKMSIVAER